MLFWLAIIAIAIAVIIFLAATVAGVVLDKMQPEHWRRRKQRYLWPCYVAAFLVLIVCFWSSFSRIQIKLAFGDYHSVSMSVLKGMLTASFCKDRIPGVVESGMNTFPIATLDRVADHPSSLNLVAAILRNENVSICEYTGYSDSECFYHHLDTPAWLLLFPILLYPAMTGAFGMLRFVRAKRKELRGACLSCNYNLTGNVSGVCPECGTAIARNAG